MIKQIARSIKVSCLVVLILLPISALYFYHFIQSPLSVGNGYVLEIAPGTSVQKIAEQLFKDGVLKNSWPFLGAVRWLGAWNALKAGEYLIKPGMTPVDVIQELREGKVIQHAIVIVPGSTFQRLMDELNQNAYLSHTLNELKPEEIMAKLGHPGEHPEGRFFADTYYFPKGTTDFKFLQRAYTVLHQKLKVAWENRAENLAVKSAYEALILASIIEKESSIIDEYSDISGVYTRRLEKSMPLQADPTVIYGAGKDYTGRITKDMLKTETPYNTYQIAGLPPTPIAFPSEKALYAAVHPTPGDTLYFVARTDGKGHVFSRTLEEHQINVQQYRKAKSATQIPVGNP